MSEEMVFLSVDRAAAELLYKKFSKKMPFELENCFTGFNTSQQFKNEIPLFI